MNSGNQLFVFLKLGQANILVIMLFFTTMNKEPIANFAISHT